MRATVLNQIGMVPLSQDKPGRLTFDCEASARNKVFPPGLTEEMVAADPDLLRVRPVDVTTFWDDLEEALEFNPVVGADDAPMAEQARTLLALREGGSRLESIDRSRCTRSRCRVARQRQVPPGGRRCRATAGSARRTAGLWGTDWFGRAQAAVIYIFVNDFHEALYFIRGTDAAERLSLRPVPLHDDLPAWGVATGGRDSEAGSGR